MIYLTACEVAGIPNNPLTPVRGVGFLIFRSGKVFVGEIYKLPEKIRYLKCGDCSNFNKHKEVCADGSGYEINKAEFSIACVRINVRFDIKESIG